MFLLGFPSKGRFTLIRGNAVALSHPVPAIKQKANIVTGRGRITTGAIYHMNNQSDAS